MEHTMAIELTLATAQQEAYHYLRDRILGGELPGNTRVNPAEIAETLGISRMPVREALRQLNSEGLVTMRPNRAAFVSSLIAREVEELFEIRAALEVLAVKSAVLAMTPDLLGELVALKDRMDRARNDPAEWLKRHDDFHQAICALGDRTRLPQELGRIRLAIRPYLLMYMRVFNTVEMPGLEHGSLLEALSSGDIKRAEKAMREHVTNPALGLIKFLQERDAEALKKKNIPPQRIAPRATRSSVDQSNKKVALASDMR
jgi:DNA-binding GntR family transcriptional regulator